MDDVRRLITVELFTETFRYVGDIVIIGVGHNKRLTDYLNSSQPFIPLLNSKLFTINGEMIREEEIVIINKDAIKFVFPLEEVQEKNQERTKKYIDSEKYFKEFGGGPADLNVSGTRRVRPSPPLTTNPPLSTPSPTRTQKLTLPQSLSETNPFLKKPEEEK